MRVLSWNVNKRRGVGRIGQMSALCAAVPDIVALQEVTPPAADDFCAALSDTGLVYSTRAINDVQRAHGVLVISRWPLSSAQKIGVPRSDSMVSVMITSPYGLIEFHAVHVPNGGSYRADKIATFDCLYTALAQETGNHRILCGDFNSPDKEFSQDNIITFGGRVQATAERRVIQGLAHWDLEDVYWTLPRADCLASSWYLVRKGERTRGRRFDHIFASASLHPTSCRYHESWLIEGLSDHVPVEVDFQPDYQSILQFNSVNQPQS